MLWQPHQYQLNAVKFLLSTGSGSLWLEPGLGKTSITLQAIKALKDAGQVRKVLILAPLDQLTLYGDLKYLSGITFAHCHIPYFMGLKR